MDMDFMDFDEIIDEIRNAYDKKEYAKIKALLSELNPADIAAVFDEFPENQRLLFFRLLSKEEAADTFVELDSDSQEALIHAFSDAELKEVVDELYLDDAVDVIEEMPATVVKRILKNADKETRDSINALLKYPEDSAGSIMTPEFVDLKRNMTVEDAFKRIRRTGVDKETIYTCYCMDDKRKLVGTIPLRKLIVAPENQIVKDIMEDDEQLIFVNTMDDQEEVAAIAKKYDLLSIPVVDKEERLVGIITIDDIVDVIEDENTEDFEKMALLLPSEDSYLKTGIFTLYRNRIVWLLILMVSATFTGQIIEGFEDKLSMIAGLTASIPMLMDTGGNCGNQVSTLVIRGLALGDIHIKDFFKIIWKEIRVAVLCGLTLAVVNYARMWIIKLVTHNDISSNTFIVVCLAMICAVIVAKVIGCALPILAKLLHLDPALMAGPMITTIVDALTLLIYFGFATLFINSGLLVGA